MYIYSNNSYKSQSTNHMSSKGFIIVLLLCFHNLSFAQLCEGNLGENIFTQGDFGSGEANIPPNDPGIAPGYTYSTNPPPNDGSYCLTNDITVWNQYWGWSNIGDNSTDPDGYMMIVNASYDTGLFYEQVIDGLCENTIYEFSADVRNLHSTSGLILPNVSYLIDDIIEYSSGNVPANNKWNTYGFTFTTDLGQDEVKLSLANNAPGGNGNDLAIDNITFRACGPEALILPTEVANICEDGNSVLLDATINGDQYDNPQVQWQQSFDGGITWVDLIGETNLIYEFSNLAGGTYYYRYKLASAPENLLNNKCRVISNTKIVEVIPKFTSIIDSLCQGLEFIIGNNTYQNSGVYVDSLQNRLGCDSIVTSDLTFVPDPQISPSFSTQETNCSYTADGSIFLDNIQNGVTPFTILFEGVELIDPSVVTNLQRGNYEYLITDRYGCSVTEFVELEGPDPYIVDLGEDLSVELGDIISIKAVSNEPTNSLVWFPPEVIPCAPNCEEQTWAPIESTWIEISALSENNCIDIDSVFIEVRKTRKIYIPNSFSPNNDNINDDFIVFARQPNVQLINRLQVYDRWGNVIFEANEVDPNDQSVSWDGQYKNREIDPGVYTYLIDVLFLDNEVISYTGTITIIR